MKCTRAAWLVSILGIILLLGAAGAYAQTIPTSIAISPASAQVNKDRTQQFTAKSTAPADLGLGEIQQIAGGANHTCAVLADGTVKCWGRNNHGQLGNGTTTDSLKPVSVKILTGAVAIAAGSNHTCAVLNTGKVWCWGDNSSGQLGDGTDKMQSSKPVEVANITNAKGIAAGDAYSCAVLADGKVKCWGDNTYAQLGDNSTTQRKTPVEVSGLTRAVEVAAGGNHTCALLAPGTVWCWGRNNHGQLARGNTSAYALTPVQVTQVINQKAKPLTNVVAIAAGGGAYGGHTCAVLASGTAKCWGYNDNGQLGVNDTADRERARTVSNLSSVVAIAAGEAHTCALDSGGFVWCWGENLSGQLGSLAASPVKTAQFVLRLSRAVGIAAGNYHTCAPLADGSAKCWGDNEFGQLGDGSGTTGATRVEVNGNSLLPGRGATAVAAGDAYTCAVLATGTAECWGDNNRGQLGNGTKTTSKPYGISTPAAVTGLTDAVAIAAGEAHTCALLSDGTVECWGWNSDGQLGNGSKTDSSNPVHVIDKATGHALKNAVAIAAGAYHSCALRADGTVWCWGANGNGQLGDGSTTQRSTPVQVTGLTNAVAIAAGGAHTCALQSDGTVRCWGYNDKGQLGNGSTNSNGVSKPVAVSGLSNAVAIAAGNGHSCALLSDGRVWCWGWNNHGQLGDGSKTNRSTPVEVSNLTDAIAISAGDVHTCAVRASGTAKCWGDNGGGQLGDGSTTERTVPADVKLLSGAVAIAAGTYHTCALKADGMVKCWGLNTYGELGDGTTTDRPKATFTAALVPSLTWGSLNTSVATIDSTGLATGKNVGEAVIEAIYGDLAATANLTVTQP